MVNALPFLRFSLYGLGLLLLLRSFCFLLSFSRFSRLSSRSSSAFRISNFLISSSRSLSTVPLFFFLFFFFFLLLTFGFRGTSASHGCCRRRRLSPFSWMVKLISLQVNYQQGNLQVRNISAFSSSSGTFSSTSKFSLLALPSMLSLSGVSVLSCNFRIAFG